MRTSTVAFVAILGLVFCAAPSHAQQLGTFRWQQQPYCNILTLNVVQSAGVFQLDGTDNQCGAPTQAAVVGIAFFNPNGSIGLGLTLVTTPGGTPLHIDASISVATVSGTWHDNTGSTGPFVFVAGAGTGGAVRPSPIPRFQAGLAAGNARVTDVGTPTAPQDAANKGYVDAGQSVVRAQLFRQFILTGGVAPNGGKISSGPFTSSRSGVGNYLVSYSVTGLGITTEFTPPLVVATPDQFCTGGSAVGSWSTSSPLPGQ